MSFADWLDDRIGWRSIWRASCGGGCDAFGRCWWPICLSVIFFLLVQQAITGFFLWMYYSPSSQTAWESVYFIQYQIPLGWLLRGLHYWSAQVLVGFLALTILIHIFTRFYTAPREWVFWTRVLLLGFALGACLTGDLLRWDQEGYAATQTRVSFLMLLPRIGGALYRLAVGGAEFGHLTLTRFFALHVAVFGIGIWLLALAHAALSRRAARAVEERPRDYPLARPDPRFSVLIQGVACLVTLAVVFLLVCQRGLPGLGSLAAWQSPADHMGAPLGAPADTDPAHFYAAARPEWSFRGLYGFSNIFPGELKILPIFVIPGLIAILVILMPILGRWQLGHVWNIFVTLVIVGGLAYFTYTSYRHDWLDADFQKARAAGEEEAKRTVELIALRGGIPPAGALSLLREDPKLEGPRLYEQQCLSCHNFSGPDPLKMVGDNPSAPDLYGFATREWLKGFFDPKQISSEKYFGNTRFAAGVMVRYVEERFTKLPPEDQEAVIAALSAEARLPSQREIDRRDAALIARGRQIIASQECARCHRFYDAGPVGQAPDLTGYGSREWLIGIIASPQHVHFYSLRNDRMPQFVEDAARPEKNRFSPTQVSVLADFLRGDWPEKSADTQEKEKEEAVPPPATFVLGQWDARKRDLPARPTGDRQAEARWLWEFAQCSLCHGLSLPENGISAVSPVAADLGGFATREWIAGLLDPKQIDSDKYFGKTAFAKGDMVEFVKGNLRELISDIGKEEFDKLIDALAAEAKKDWPDGQEPPEPDEDTLYLFEDFTCADCHKFYSVGGGSGPDLTGYGSKKWIAAFIADPKSKRFYPNTNDGMPSYHAFPDTPGKNLLTKEEIDILAEFLAPKK